MGGRPGGGGKIARITGSYKLATMVLVETKGYPNPCVKRRPEWSWLHQTSSAPKSTNILILCHSVATFFKNPIDLKSDMMSFIDHIFPPITIKSMTLTTRGCDASMGTNLMTEPSARKTWPI
jgi:hypothetical protein